MNLTINTIPAVYIHTSTFLVPLGQRQKEQTNLGLPIPHPLVEVGRVQAPSFPLSRALRETKIVGGGCRGMYFFHSLHMPIFDPLLFMYFLNATGH